MAPEGDYTLVVAEGIGQVREEELDPQARIRRQRALAQIRQYGDPVLRMRANDVEQFDDDLAALVERMLQLMTDANGVGLAANQVGVVRRVFVFQHGREDGEERLAVVNPRLVHRSEETVEGDEGCLSLQGVIAPVLRSEGVTLEGQDPQGRSLRLDLRGLAARVAQHELDHLDGVLIIDRTTPESRRAALRTLRPEPVLGPLG